MRTIASRLKSFATARENALREKGMFDGGKAKAVTEIKKKASWCSKMEENKQLSYVRQLEKYILDLIPSELSQFQKQRNEMLELLTLAKS